MEINTLQQLVEVLWFGLRNAYSKPFHDSTSFASTISLALSAVTEHKEIEGWKIIKFDQYCVIPNHDSENNLEMAGYV
jgi:hypothetical protein